MNHALIELTKIWKVIAMMIDHSMRSAFIHNTRGLLKSETGYLGYWIGGDDVMKVRETFTFDKTKADNLLVDFIAEDELNIKQKRFEDVMAALIILSDDELLDIEREVQYQFGRRGVHGCLVNEKVARQGVRREIDTFYPNQCL